jgi:hypothetical protein
MRPNNGLILVLLFIVFTHAVSAERSIVTTIGPSSCTSWTAERKKALGSGLLDSYGASLSRAWIFGYLSAVNALVEQEKDLLGVIDVDAIVLWVDRYCVRNPKKGVSDGLVELVIELRKIAP